MRILLVSSLYPGPDDPDYGPFVRSLAGELEAQGHEVVRVVTDRRSGGLGKQVGFALRAAWAAIRHRPDVVYAHFLVPAGAIAAVASRLGRAPLVVTAHGRDVRNIGELRGVERLTRMAVRRASAIIAVSDYLRGELLTKLPEAGGARSRSSTAGVDLERFAPRDAAAARRQLGWEGEAPFFLCVGTLDERKNVVRLAEAFARLGRGSLAFVGDGPLRERAGGDPGPAPGRPASARGGRRLGRRVRRALPAEPRRAVRDQALLEGMARERSVVATRIGGPPEFVPPEAGVLVDPESVDSIESGLRAAAELPSPNPAARAAAAKHDVSVEARRIGELLQKVTR